MTRAPCLHRYIKAVIERYTDETGHDLKEDGFKLIDTSRVEGAFIAILSELMAGLPDEMRERQIDRFAKLLRKAIAHRVQSGDFLPVRLAH
jgi:hypothetical protein